VKVEDDLLMKDVSSFMRLPTHEEQKACYRAFRLATSNEALLHSICVVCGREMWTSEGSEKINGLFKI